jgi:hypothetical protein
VKSPALRDVEARLALMPAQEVSDTEDHKCDEHHQYDDDDYGISSACFHDLPLRLSALDQAREMAITEGGGARRPQQS